MFPERVAVVAAVAHFDDHHETAAQNLDVHLLDADPPETRLNLGPDGAVMTRIRIDDRGIVFQVERKHVALAAAHWFSTPPSSGYACPVTKDASSEQRYNARYATSS